MVWVKLDDNALTNPAWLALPRTARLLHLEALSWSNRHGADGYVPAGVLRMLTDEPEPEATARLLVRAGAWQETASGWRLVWLLDDQPTAEEVERERERGRARQKRWTLHTRGDHSQCHPDRCPVARRGVTNAVSGAVSNDVSNGRRTGVSNDAPTRPDPTRPDRRSESEGTGARRPGAPAPSQKEQIANLRAFLDEPGVVPEARKAAEGTLRRLVAEEEAGK